MKTWMMWTLLGLYTSPAAGQCILEERIKFGAAVPAAEDRFGSDLDVDGDNLLIGAMNFNGPGRALVFRRSGGQWIERTGVARFFAAELLHAVDGLP